MAELDESIGRHCLEGGCHHFYRRDFYCRQNPRSFAWDAGGRFYSIGKDSYQNLKPTDRLAMKIDSEPVVEIDIVASGLTIYSRLMGHSIDLDSDPYLLPGLPRHVTKARIVRALEKGRLAQQWPAGTTNDTRRWPIGNVANRVLAHFPILADLMKSGLTTLDFQYWESCIMLGTMLHLLRQQEIVSLNMHDGLIVQARNVARAAQCLRAEFQLQIGCTPMLRTSPHIPGT